MELKKQIKVMKFIYIILRLVFFLGGIMSMYFVSHFWLGTLEQWNKLIETDIVRFFFNRELATLTIGLFFIIIGLLVNLIFRKVHGLSRNKLKYIFISELLVTMLISIFFVSIALGIVN